MTKNILIYIATGLLCDVAVASDYTLDSSIKNGNAVEFLKFEGSGEFENYLTMNLPFDPMLNLLNQVSTTERLDLKSRGEAHITVITPVEYWNILRPLKITMTEINDIAESMRIQNSSFEIICLGRGTAEIKNKTEHAFFVVVTSNELINIRKAVQNLFVSKGGRPEDFNPTNYHPHITLGFTQRDLHESDGVIKGSNSCIAGIDLTN